MPTNEDTPLPDHRPNGGMLDIRRPEMTDGSVYYHPVWRGRRPQRMPGRTPPSGAATRERERWRRERARPRGRR